MLGKAVDSAPSLKCDNYRGIVEQLSKEFLRICTNPKSIPSVCTFGGTLGKDLRRVDLQPFYEKRARLIAMLTCRALSGLLRTSCAWTRTTLSLRCLQQTLCLRGLTQSSFRSWSRILMQTTR